MALFKKAPQPARNKQGYSKLTYKNAELIAGTSTDKHGNDRDYEFIKLNFSAMGIDRSNPQPMSVNLSPRIDLSNPESYSYRVLANMGMPIPEVKDSEIELETDDDGFEQEAIEVSEDGFEVDSESQSDEFSGMIEEFLKSCMMTDFLAFVQKNKKGFWDIDVDSLKPHIK